LPGRLGDALDGRRPDAARRIVDDAAQADLVARRDGQLQVGDRILDLFALEERLPADHLVRERLRAQRLLDRLRLDVRAVEDGEVARAIAARRAQGFDLAGDELGLAVGVLARDHLQLVARRLGRPQPLVVALLV